MLFIKLPIDRLTHNSIEMLKVSLIKLLLDNRRYKSNPQNANSDDLPFDLGRWTDKNDVPTDIFSQGHKKPLKRFSQGREKPAANHPFR